jgi:hypothetical protein
MMDGLAFLPVPDLTNGIHLLRTLCPDDPPEAAMSLLSTLRWWITDGILLDNSTDSSFFLLTPLDDTPYRRMGMSYQVEEIVVPALAHVVGSGITVDCGIMYVPNGWWKQVGYVLRPDGLLDFVLDSAV